jgi:hypothetical protein
MRAWYQWLLLRTYAGYPDGGGECLGFPIVTSVLTTSDNLDRPRNTYEECVAQIARDCDSAIVLLPKWYNGSASYNNNSNAGRGSAMAAWALKARYISMLPARHTALQHRISGSVQHRCP